VTPAQETAFRAQFDAHADRVFAFLRRLCVDRQLAEDLFQETWCSAAREFGKLDASRSLLPWLLSTARNHWRMHRRWVWVDVSRWLVTEVAPAVADHSPGPEAEAAQAQEARRLERAVVSLGDREREVLLLSFDEALTPSERAAVLGVSEDAYRQRSHRARRALEAKLKVEEAP
jgi:RNA polymerase sigma-70 factor (ECF subfamily)